MEQVEVEITSTAVTQMYGTLAPGDILRTDAAFAKHLVEDAQAAKYTKPPHAGAEIKKEKKTPEAEKKSK